MSDWRLPGILSAEDVAAVMDMPSAGPAVSNPPITSTSMPFVSQFHTFQWTPTGADWVFIRMTVENGMMEDGFETVSCAVIDDGEFDFGNSYWRAGTLYLEFFNGMLRSMFRASRA